MKKSGPNPATRMPAAEAQAIVFKERERLTWVEGAQKLHISKTVMQTWTERVFYLLCNSNLFKDVSVCEPPKTPDRICTSCARAWIKERGR